jgi:hypothetical protein
MFEIVLVQIRGRFNIGLGQDRIMFCLSLGWVWNGVFFLVWFKFGSSSKWVNLALGLGFKFGIKLF